MAKKLSEQVASLLHPFLGALGDKFDKTVADCASMLGRQQVTTLEGEWKTASGMKLSAKDSHKMQLPLNNPTSHLIWFAIRLREVSVAGDFVITATLPKACEAWIANMELVAS
jgi:hypothetical protein